MNRRLSISNPELRVLVEDVDSDCLVSHSHFFATAPSDRHYPISPSPVPTPTAENPLHLMQTADSEHSLTFDNRSGLAHDLGFLAAMPELCDVTFLAGEERQPVCGVRAVLAARSRSAYFLLSLSLGRARTQPSVHLSFFVSPHLTCLPCYSVFV